jgi:hypothetical protein
MFKDSNITTDNIPQGLQKCFTNNIVTDDIFIEDDITYTICNENINPTIENYAANTNRISKTKPCSNRTKENKDLLIRTLYKKKFNNCYTLTDRSSTDDQLTDAQSIDDQLTDTQTTDDKLTDAQLTYNKLIDYQSTDDQSTDDQSTEQMFTIISNSNLNNVKNQYHVLNNTIYKFNDNVNDSSCANSQTCCVINDQKLVNGSTCCSNDEIIDSTLFGPELQTILQDDKTILSPDNPIMVFKNNSNIKYCSRTTTQPTYNCSLYSNKEEFIKNDYYIISNSNMKSGSKYNDLYNDWTLFCPPIDNGTSYSCNFTDINKTCSLNTSTGIKNVKCSYGNGCEFSNVYNIAVLIYESEANIKGQIVQEIIQIPNKIGCMRIV